MTQVRLLTDRASATFTQRNGDVIDMPADEAKRLVAASQAEWLEDTNPPATRRLRGRQPQNPTSQETNSNVPSL